MSQETKIQKLGAAVVTPSGIVTPAVSPRPTILKRLLSRPWVAKHLKVTIGASVIVLATLIIAGGTVLAAFFHQGPMSKKHAAAVAAAVAKGSPTEQNQKTVSSGSSSTSPSKSAQTDKSTPDKSTTSTNGSVSGPVSTPSSPPGTIAAPSSCVSPTNFPSPPNGGLTYVNWHFNQGNLNTITHSVDIKNNPGTSSDLFLQLYDANIDNTGQYYGLQTIGLAIFSQFGTTNSSANIVTGPGSYAVFGTNEGPFISLRHNFGSLPVGHYTTTVQRTNYDGTGDWFAYYVTMPGSSATYIGSIRFPRANGSVPASFRDGGGSWTEFWDNNNSTTLYPVPTWSVSLSSVANGSIAPVHAVSSYSAMPNSDISVSAGNIVNFALGGSTARCHSAGSLW